jgi:hypothetical protein
MDGERNPGQSEQSAALEADCERLARLLSERRVPKLLRRGARAALREAFAATSDPEAELQAVSQAVDSLLRKVDAANPFVPRLLAVPMPEFVRIGALRRHRFAVAIDRRWSRRGDRLEAIIDWFWERCQPQDGGRGRPLTARDKALDEFGQDMEYVWGKRGPRRQ